MPLVCCLNAEMVDAVRLERGVWVATDTVGEFCGVGITHPEPCATIADLQSHRLILVHMEESHVAAAPGGPPSSRRDTPCRTSGLRQGQRLRPHAWRPRRHLSWPVLSALAPLRSEEVAELVALGYAAAIIPITWANRSRWMSRRCASVRGLWSAKISRSVGHAAEEGGRGWDQICEHRSGSADDHDASQSGQMLVVQRD